MSPRTGRPPSEKSKRTMLRVRLDNDDIQDMSYCAEKLNTSNSEVVRKGIRLVKSEIDKK
jgi:hypothetical protein